MTRIRALFVAGCFTVVGGNALANGLYENRSWQFQTSADKANNAFVLDMIERKNGGFYDSFETIINNNYNTTIEGGQINCNLAPNAVGNQSASAMDSVTSSPNVAPGSNIHVGASGNEGLNNGGGGQSALNSEQNNTGDQSASASNLHASAGAVNASGGRTSQVLNNNQNNSGSQQASVTDSQACSFDGAGGGAPLN